MQRSLLAWVLALLIPAFALAHSGGSVYEKPVDGKLVRVTYSTDEIAPLAPVRFTFDLMKGAEDATRVDFARVWVKVEEGPALRFVSWLGAPSLGPTGMSYAFPHAGKYLLTVRYENEQGEKIAEASFGLEAKDEGSFAVPPIFWVGVGTGTALAGLAWLIVRARSK